LLSCGASESDVTLASLNLPPGLGNRELRIVHLRHHSSFKYSPPCSSRPECCNGHDRLDGDLLPQRLYLGR
jgi:hypothetical protein